MATLRLATAANIRLFQSLSASLATSDAKCTTLINPEALDDEFGRFRVWSGNLGALQKGHSSLDYRLRDSPLLSSNALKFLKELEENLTEAIAVVSGSRLPYELQPKPEDSDGEDDFFSEDEDDESQEVGAPKTELEQRFREVVDIVQNLYKLSVRIRSPTLRSRSLKAASFQPKDAETGVDILEQYTTFDLQYTQELVRFLRAPYDGDVKVEDEVLIKRLSKAITLRRRQFKYWRRHRDKLGVSTLLEDLTENQPATVERPEVHRHDTLEVQLGNPIVASIKESDSEREPKSLLSGTEATQHHQSLDDIVDSQSVTSYATTTHDLKGHGIELPSPPKAANGEQDFECPYCFIICPARYGRGRPWRTHLLQDLQPYVCTYEDCENPDQLLRSRREWAEHEASHRKVWRCPEHTTAIYKSKLGLEDHLRRKHSDSFPEHQLTSIIKVSETSTIDLRQKCPICFAQADMEGGLQNHIANHLERLASFALPKDIDTAGDESDVASSVASRGRSGTTESSQDLSSVSFHTGSVSVKDEQRPTDEAASTIGEGPMPTLNKGGPPGEDNQLSVELVGRVPDSSKKRMDVLTSQLGDLTSLDDEFFDEGDDSVEVKEHLAEVGNLRSYLLSLAGAQSTRFLRRYGWWRGYLNFSSEDAAVRAIATFDKEQYPEVKIRLGVENRASLKFSLPALEKPKPNQGAHTTLEDDSVSSASLSENGELEADGKLPILPVDEIPTFHLLYRSRKLQQRDQSYAPNDSYNRMLGFTFYDITRIKADAIVNSANKAMRFTRRYDTLNHYIHKAAGPGLKRECAQLGSVRTGQVRVTSGCNLPSSYVIHAARPQYSGSKGMGKFNVLTECYRSSLKAAVNHNMKTIVFPCIAAGGCGFPSRVAARIALQETREFLDVHKSYQFERIIFCVYKGSDEKAYRDFIPVFFPPTHGDLENAVPLDNSRDPNSLASQLQDAYIQIERVTQSLVIFSDNIREFPRNILRELSAIISTVRSLKNLFVSSKGKIKNLAGWVIADLDLICSVMQSVSQGVMEIVEQTKYARNFDGPTYKTIWDEYNLHMQNSQGMDLNTLLEICRDFAQCIDDILIRNGIEPHEMGTMRIRLSTYRLKQTGEGNKAQRDAFDEAMFTRDFHRETITYNHTNIIKVHQIPSLSRLYQLGELEPEPTNAIPDGIVNNTVSLIREDISRLEVDVIVNSTDIGFSGMGTLDRTIFRKGGLSLQEDCADFGVCKEGDVRLTGGYQLPARHIIHAIPPDTYRKNTKDVLRKIYREILHVASSLKATSLAIPTIGTGMLNYPKRDAASVAMEEVKRYLETTEAANPIERIIFCVFGSNDESIYKSLLPVFFPPVETNVNKALPPSSSLQLKSNDTTKATEPAPPPRRTLFGSIGDAIRNVRFGKQPVSQTLRPLQSGEETALINYESHAQGCSTCSKIAQLYAEDKDLCVDGYGKAQCVLQYLYMEADRSVYSTLDSERSVKVEFPQEYKHSWNLLVTVEKSYRDIHRSSPFVTVNQPYPSTEQRGHRNPSPPPGVTIYNAEVTIPIKKEPEKAIASVFSWSDEGKRWEALHPFECSIHIYPGKFEVYETDHIVHTQGVPLLSLELTPLVPLEQHVSTEITITARTFQESRLKSENFIMLRSRSPAECEMLFQRLKHARNNNPTYLEHQSVQEAPAMEETEMPLELPSAPSHEPSSTKALVSTLTQQLHAERAEQADLLPVEEYWRTQGAPPSDFASTLPTVEENIHPDPQPRLSFSASVKEPHEQDKIVPVDHLGKFNLASAELSYVNIDEYYSYVNLASTQQHSIEDRWDSRPPHHALSADTGSDQSAGNVDTDISYSTQLPNEDGSTADYRADIPLDDPRHISHSRPTTPEEGEKTIPLGARWTKINRRLIDPYALNEAGMPFEERGNYIVVLTVLSPEDIQNLVERTKAIRATQQRKEAIYHKQQTELEMEGGRASQLKTEDQVQVKAIPAAARWTKIDRRLVSAQALEEANERFEQREDESIVKRVLTRKEIVKLAERTREIRGGKVELRELAMKVGEGGGEDR
ncbi:uncharacterized protein BDR25DRAFT_385695 [Lindgomyces ingoldianus]|uniref:Uncharacterized protein n=1 Tax=Lindgomyces ingoldianus TaxID=673940 RepID=A0ACB6R4W8_9PLEO|nr:uncharacterized protein BDR25DRAFT_385695 [Lindgomyces ingoldianus]KAF2474226.1 hypothetical protein BDR25DRAFT_385695 [Lindgomyces ingoldianus]